MSDAWNEAQTNPTTAEARDEYIARLEAELDALRKAYEDTRQDCIARTENLMRLQASDTTDKVSDEIEDALWALHSYESNRGDGGRNYSEADITRMVQAVRSTASSAMQATIKNAEAMAATGASATHIIELFRAAADRRDV